MNKDEILLKKWELLWNHYKLQNECIEKRRNFLWIIQALIFAGYYHYLKDQSLINVNLGRLLSFAGLFISIIWVLVLNRERKSTLITEMALRDVEVEWNALCNDIILNRFILDKALLKEREGYDFKYIDDKFVLRMLEKYSASWILNNLIPFIIIFFWLVIIFGFPIACLFVVVIYFIWRLYEKPTQAR